MNPVVVELAIRRGAEMVFDVAGAFDGVGIGRAALELVEQRAVRLAHHLRQHVEAAAMRHTEHDLLHAEIAAALDDLLQRRDQRLSPIEPEALGAGELDVAEFFETLRLDQLVEDRALALAGESDLLVGALNALLNPAFLLRVRDVHELDAHRLAVGAAQDRDDLAHGAGFKTEDLVEEYLAIHVGFAEGVTARIELLVVLGTFEAEWIQIGMEVAADAVGADQHQRMDGIARRLLHIGRAELDTGVLRLATNLVAELLLGFGPLAIQRGEKLVAFDQRRLLPRGAARALRGIRAVLHAAEEVAPTGIDRVRVSFVSGVEVFDVGGVAAIEKRGECESRVRVLPGLRPHPGFG